MKKTEKIRFEIDPHNRLVYEKTGRKSNIPGFRTVVDGRFGEQRGQTSKLEVN